MGLRAFEAASRCLSFQQAARELHVTPGAVSRQIQNLEEQLGAALFLRHHKRVELTPLGRHYADEIRLPLRQLAEATARVQGETRGKAISVCAYPSFAIRWFIPRWGRFYDAYPHIDLRLTTSLNPADFDSREYDMAIQVLPGSLDRSDSKARPGLQARKLLEIDTFPICSPELAKTIKTPADLAGQTLLHNDPRPQDWPRWLEVAGVSNLDVTKGLRFESLNLAIQAAIEGLGIAIGLGALIEADLAQGRLVRLFDVARRSGRPFHLVYPDSRAGDANVVALRDWLLAEAGMHTE
jgi:LysR family glycine cleavage system transcriptional activator